MTIIPLNNSNFANLESLTRFIQKLVKNYMENSFESCGVLAVWSLENIICIFFFLALDRYNSLDFTDINCSQNFLVSAQWEGLGGRETKSIGAGVV